VIHDLRRTVASGMAALGVATHVADKILNLQSGAVSQIVAVYQRHQFTAERKAAIELWSRHVATILREGNVSRAAPGNSRSAPGDSGRNPAAIPQQTSPIS
jgi:hypothetical protein